MLPEQAHPHDRLVHAVKGRGRKHEKHEQHKTQALLRPLGEHARQRPPHAHFETMTVRAGLVLHRSEQANEAQQDTEQFAVTEPRRLAEQPDPCEGHQAIRDEHDRGLRAGAAA